jgi:peptide deformylase
MLESLINDTGACVSDMCAHEEYAQWVRTPARKVDLENEYSLAWKISHIMKEFIQKYNWVAASSNNIYWKTTDMPISVMAVPSFSGIKTLVNPEIVNTSEKQEYGIEGCGSIGEALFYKKRPLTAEIKAYVLEEHNYRTVSFHEHEAKSAMHEYDHLKGKLISDNSVFLGFYPEDDDTRWLRSVIKNWISVLDMLPEEEPLHLVLEHNGRPAWHLYEKDFPQMQNYGRSIAIAVPNIYEITSFLGYFPLDTVSKNSFLKTPVHGFATSPFSLISNSTVFPR